MAAAETHDLIQQCMNVYDVKSINKLATVTGIPASTLYQWNDEKMTPIGELLLKALIENQQLRKAAHSLIESEQTKRDSIAILREILEGSAKNSDPSLQTL